MGKSVFYDRLEAIVLARQYKSKTQFRIENRALYSYAKRHGWWHEMSKFMENGLRVPKKWNEDSIRECAAKFKVKKDFQKHAPGAYAAARKMGIIVDVCRHMDRRLLAEERVNGRECSRCGEFTLPEDVAGNSASCLACHSKRTSAHAKANPAWKASTVAKRRARIARAIPPWVGRGELRQIQKFYEAARKRSDETGVPHEVDHIYPIAGRNICGLHVPQNLRVIPKSENRRKSNKVVDL